MLYTPLIKKALDLSYKIHEKQMDRQGNPYVFRLYYIAMQMEQENEICTALLKDILEERTMSIQDLAGCGFSESILEALQLLKRPKTMSYESYLRRVKENELAKKVLIQDISYELLQQSETAGMDMQKKTSRRQNALSFLSA